MNLKVELLFLLYDCGADSILWSCLFIIKSDFRGEQLMLPSATLLELDGESCLGFGNKS